MSGCVCSLSYPLCKAHAPCCHLWSLWLHHIFPHSLIKGTDVKVKWKWEIQKYVRRKWKHCFRGYKVKQTILLELISFVCTNKRHCFMKVLVPPHCVLLLPITSSVALLSFFRPFHVPAVHRTLISVHMTLSCVCVLMYHNTWCNSVTRESVSFDLTKPDTTHVIIFIRQ